MTSRYTLYLSISLLLAGCGAPTPTTPVLPYYADAPQRCAITPEDLHTSLFNAAAAEGWKLLPMGRNHLQAERSTGNKSLRIAVSQAGPKVYLTYLGSRGMGYDGSVIDRDYHEWIRRLKAAFATETARHCIVIPPVETVEPAERSELLETIDSPVMVETVPEELMIVR